MRGEFDSLQHPPPGNPEDYRRVLVTSLLKNFVFRQTGVAKLATFSLCRSQWIGKIAVLSRAAKILHRLHELHYLRRSQKYVSIAHAAAIGIRVPLSQALFSVAEVSKQFAYYNVEADKYVAFDYFPGEDGASVNFEFVSNS